MQAIEKYYYQFKEACKKEAVECDGFEKAYRVYIDSIIDSCVAGNAKYGALKAIRKFDKYLRLVLRTLSEVLDENMEEGYFMFNPTHMLVALIKLRNSLYRKFIEVSRRSD